MSKNGLSVSSQIYKYPKYIYSTIQIDNWLQYDGRYYFKFKFKGEISCSSDEIAIGFCTSKYDHSFDRGIGAENNSYSWYCTGHRKSSIYVLKIDERLQHGLGNNDEFSFEMFIENNGTSFYVNLLYQRDDIPVIDEKECIIKN